MATPSLPQKTNGGATSSAGRGPPCRGRGPRGVTRALAAGLWAMTAICQAYDNTADAERAVADLLAAGVPGDDVRLLMGAEIHDARREARGRFSGSVPPPRPGA